MTRQYAYHLVDVFTNRRFGGNQLAVFTDARGLSDEEMQQIAKEMNLSESSFILPSEDKQNDFRLRIFTPGAELPMAGHPTVGTAYVMAYEEMIDVSQDTLIVRFEEGVGPIPVRLEFPPGESGQHPRLPTKIMMQQHLPEFGPVFEDRAAIAEMLSISPDNIEESLPLEVVSCGVPFLYVPLRSLTAVHNVKLRLDLWEKLLADYIAREVFVFSRSTVTDDATVHSRMFAPNLGIMEDPATGAASGPLGCYLVTHGLVSAEQGENIISEQGFEIGRPSFITISIQQEAGQISAVHVGGQCVHVGQGTIEL
jgi:trans-2,3-dihydro-3-hydroxyanthranilate isomerase